MIPGICSGSLELVVVTEITDLEQPSGANFTNPQPAKTMEIWKEVISSVATQDMVTSGYQLSDLENIEIDWDDPDLNMDAVFRPGIKTPFSSSTFNDFEMGSIG